MVVAMPPTEVDRPNGISRSEAGVAVFNEILIRIGSSRITTGVLLTNALSIAAITSAAKNASFGLCVHQRASCRPIGSSAPVRTSAWPAIISAQTAISAW